MSEQRVPRRRYFSNWVLKIFMMPEQSSKVKKAKLECSESRSLFCGNVQIRLGYRLDTIQVSLPHSSLVGCCTNSTNQCFEHLMNIDTWPGALQNSDLKLEVLPNFYHLSWTIILIVCHNWAMAVPWGYRVFFSPLKWRIHLIYPFSLLLIATLGT